MPAENFVVCKRPFANSLNPDEDQQNVGLDLDPNYLTLQWWSGWFICKKKLNYEESQQTKIKT